MKNFEIHTPKTGMLVERRFKSKDLPRNQQVAGVITKIIGVGSGWPVDVHSDRVLVQVQWPDQSREHLVCEFLRRMI